MDEYKVMSSSVKRCESGRRNCSDDAAVETFFKTLKTELIRRDIWNTGNGATIHYKLCNPFIGDLASLTRR